jgi:membrane protein
MTKVDRIARAADTFQRRRAWLALPVAVMKKFGDDRGGNLTALVAYYGFLSLFPLLLLLVTIVDILLSHDKGLQQRLLNSALAHYPVIGPQLEQSIGPLHETGLALLTALVGIVIGVRGVALAIQNALNSAWEIPRTRRPRFPWNYLRAFALVAIVTIGMTGSTILSAVAGWAGGVLHGFSSALLALAVSLGLNFCMFWLAFRLGTAREIGWRRHLPGAIGAALCWQVLQAIGGSLVSHNLTRASNLYGTFAIVLGLIAWLYLEALLTMWVVEANVVLTYRLWPRSLIAPPYTDKDREAFRMYAQVENRGD